MSSPCLDARAIAERLERSAHAETIETDASEANRVRTASTPALEIGKSEGDVVNGYRVIGAQGFNVFQSEMDFLLLGSIWSA